MSYTCLIVDPPYNFEDGLKMSDVKRSAQSNYQTLSIDDICALPINELADPTGCLLALWVPASMLADGMKIMEAWKFSQRQIVVWVKSKKEPFKTKKDQKLDMNDMLNMGMGRLFRGSAEICLIGINNTGIYKKLADKSQRSVFFAYNEKHSKKPEILHDRLEKMFPDTNKCEIFGRREKKGWLVLGNEVGEKLDIRDSLNKLLEKEKAA